MNNYKRDSCGNSTSLAIIGYGISSAAAYLAGHLVNNNQTGVDHIKAASDYSTDFITVLNKNELQENAMKYIYTGEFRYFLLNIMGKFLPLSTSAHS